MDSISSRYEKTSLEKILEEDMYVELIKTNFKACIIVAEPPGELGEAELPLESFALRLESLDSI